MSDDGLFVCTIILSIWLSWRLSSIASSAERIADELKRFREMAERGRR
jgi:hypothetical protein